MLSFMLHLPENADCTVPALYTTIAGGEKACSLLLHAMFATPWLRGHGLEGTQSHDLQYALHHSWL